MEVIKWVFLLVVKQKWNVMGLIAKKAVNLIMINVSPLKMLIPPVGLKIQAMEKPFALIVNIQKTRKGIT